MFFNSSKVYQFRRKYLLIIFVFICFACQKQQPEPPVALEKFIPLYTDYIIAADLTEKEDIGAVLDSLLAVHQLKRADFRNNLQFYAEHPQQWQEFLEAVIEQLNQRMQQLDEKTLKKNLKPPSIQKKGVPSRANPRN